ncbi:hypothetical protein SCLARK_001741 [Spiroplasma clarkii]|uniref:Uncharacterized protein n=1 Tax=Spiroplasma clarkii TaxID=2139 RepID=A0A1Y0L2D8_9MOLU|nr:hypothetical protein [Spiroplasma clarkii]ARU92194.1 hypothetical protein SCLARK_001741 [Spiroplasma clarkii]ATX71522.1 hypothetical protein SCLAR_v1c12220 [Spiroplasma clarkii]
MKIQKSLLVSKSQCFNFLKLMLLNFKKLSRDWRFWVIQLICLAANFYFYWAISNSLSKIPRVTESQIYILYYVVNSILLFAWSFWICSKLFSKTNAENLMQLELRYGFSVKAIFWVRLLLIWIIGWIFLLVSSLLSLIWLASAGWMQLVYFNWVTKHLLIWLITWPTLTCPILFLVVFFGTKMTALFGTILTIIFNLMVFIEPSINIKNRNENNKIIATTNLKLNFGYDFYHKFATSLADTQLFTPTDFATKVKPYTIADKASFYDSYKTAPQIYEVFMCGDVFKQNAAQEYILQELHRPLFDVLDAFKELVLTASEKTPDYNHWFNAEETKELVLPSANWLKTLIVKDQAFYNKFGSLFLYLDSLKESFYYLDYFFRPECSSQQVADDFYENYSQFRIYSNLLTNIWVYAMQNPLTNAEIEVYKEPSLPIYPYGLYPINYKDYQHHNNIGLLLGFLNPFGWSKLRAQPLLENNFVSEAISTQFLYNSPVLESFDLSSIQKEIDAFQNGDYQNEFLNFDLQNSFFTNDALKPKSNLIWVLVMVYLLQVVIITWTIMVSYKKFNYKLQN